MKKKLLSLFYLSFPLIIGFIVSLIIKDYIDYSTLLKPPLAPPKVLFPIAWTIIYLLLGISFYLYKKNTQRKDWFIDFTYYTNLVINTLWSIIFFVLKWRLVAVIWIIILLLNRISLVSLFLKKNPPSAYLNIIYLLWTIFATYLTVGIYILN